MTKTRQKPNQPRENHPLFLHSNAQWARKTRGKPYYFGPWSDSDAAEPKYLQDREQLQVGVKLPQVPDGCHVRNRVNPFLIVKESIWDSGELSPRSFRKDFKAKNNPGHWSRWWRAALFIKGESKFMHSAEEAELSYCEAAKVFVHVARFAPPTSQTLMEPEVVMNLVDAIAAMARLNREDRFDGATLSEALWAGLSGALIAL